MEIILLRSPSDRLGDILHRLDGVDVPLRDQVWNLGVLLDLALSWDSQMAAMSRSGFNQLKIIAQLHPYLDEGAACKLVHALMNSRIDYCNTVYVGLT